VKYSIAIISRTNKDAEKSCRQMLHSDKRVMFPSKKPVLHDSGCWKKIPQKVSEVAKNEDFSRNNENNGNSHRQNLGIALKVTNPLSFHPEGKRKLLN
jgi:hypothetical protein